MHSIPIVDLNSPDLKNATEEQRRSRLGDQILSAFKEIGFVYLKNTGISSTLRQSTVRSALEFFALPLETKLRYHRFVRTRCNGYTPMFEEHLEYSEANGERGQQELKESWDMMVSGEDMPHEVAPNFSDNILHLMKSLDELSQGLYGALETALKRPAMMTGTHLHQLERGNATVMRVVHYPPVSESTPPGTVRCGTHSDWGSITLLLQDDVGGLEVLARDDTWVPATPIPDTILINVGDLMEIWTGGEIRATKHRVRLPENIKQRNSHRVSLVFFGQPDDEATVAPPAVTEGIKPVNAGDYLKAKYLATMPNAGTTL